MLCSAEVLTLIFDGIIYRSRYQGRYVKKRNQFEFHYAEMRSTSLISKFISNANRNLFGTKSDEKSNSEAGGVLGSSGETAGPTST